MAAAALGVAHKRESWYHVFDALCTKCCVQQLCSPALDDVLCLCARTKGIKYIVLWLNASFSTLQPWSWQCTLLVCWTRSSGGRPEGSDDFQGSNEAWGSAGLVPSFGLPFLQVRCSGLLCCSCRLEAVLLVLRRNEPCNHNKAWASNEPCDHYKAWGSNEAQSSWTSAEGGIAFGNLAFYGLRGTMDCKSPLLTLLHAQLCTPDF